MDRIDWLRGVDTALGKVVLAIALEIWVNLEGKRRMARIDWPGKSGGRFWAGKNLKAHLNSTHKTFIVLFPLLSLQNVQISVDISEN